MNQQIQRIRQMEAHLNQISEAVRNLTAALEAYEKVVPLLAELDAYYGSADWFADLDADRAGLLPKDLRRGVLSEDAIYNLLQTCRELNLPLD